MHTLAIVICRIVTTLELLQVQFGSGLDFKPGIFANDVTVNVCNGPGIITVEDALVDLPHLLPGFFFKLLCHEVFKIGSNFRGKVAAESRHLACLFCPQCIRGRKLVQADNRCRITAADVLAAQLQPFVMTGCFDFCDFTHWLHPSCFMCFSQI